jgi:hypothetical protein
MPQPMSLERYAELSARMASGQKRDEVLKSTDIDEATWETSQQYWLGKMADEAGRDRYSLAQRYGVLFKAAQAVVDGTAGRPMKRLPPRSKRQVVVHAMPVAPPPPPASAPAVAAPRSPAGAMAPPVAVAASYAARLTVEQLAAMRAEIATAPDGDQPAVLQRFGLDSASWEKEEAHWQRKLALDEPLFKRYLRQFQYCKSLLQRT